MRILVVRHGQAVDGYLADRDGERWLTDEGRRTMRRVGDWLREAEVRLHRAFTSPLVRATQTAEILASRLEFDGPLVVWPALAGGTTAGALFALEQAEPQDTVALIGHEPLVRSMVGHLIGESFTGFRTGAVCLVSTDGDSARFEWMMDPRTGERVDRLDALER